MLWCSCIVENVVVFEDDYLGVISLVLDVMFVIWLFEWVLYVCSFLKLYGLDLWIGVFGGLCVFVDWVVVWRLFGFGWMFWMM